MRPSRAPSSVVRRATLTVAATLLASAANAQTYKFTGLGSPSSHWFVGANWDNGVPNSSSANIEIGALGGPFTVNLNGANPGGPSVGMLTIGGGSSLELNSGSGNDFAIYGNALTNNGSISIPNNGEILIDQDMSLQGIGTITLANGGLLNSRVLAANIRRLTNNGNTITGGGSISTNGGMRFANNASGIVRGNDPAMPLTVQTYGGADSIVNTGLMQSASAGTLLLATTLGNPGGSVRMNNAGGTLNAHTGGTTRVTIPFVDGGTLSATMGGVMRVDNVTVAGAGYATDLTSSLIISSGTHTVGISNAGTMSIFSTATFNFAAAVNNSGQINLSSGSGSAMVFDTNASFVGNGTLNMTASPQLSGGADAELETLGNALTHTIRGLGLIGFGGGLILNNEGTIRADLSGQTLNVGLAGMTGTTIVNSNAGQLEARSGGILTISANSPAKTLQNFGPLGPGLIAAYTGSTVNLTPGATTVDGGIIRADGGTVLLSNLTRSGGRIEVKATGLVNGSSNATIGGIIEIDAGGTYSVIGTNHVFDATANVTSNGTLQITNLGALTNNGSITAATLSNGGTFSQNTALTSHITNVSGSGTTNINAGARLDVVTLRQGTVNIATTGELRLIPPMVASGTPAMSRVDALALPGTAKLDLGKAALVYDYPGGSPLSTMRTWITVGYASGTWTGNSIRSSAAAANARLGIGYVEASTLFTLPGNWLGEPVATAALLIRTTLRGDTNLDGTVNFPDLLKLAQNYGLTATGDWWLGDFNYDRIVNFPDLLALAQNYGGSFAGSATQSVDFAADWALAQSLLPEPALLWLAAVTSGRHRR